MFWLITPNEQGLAFVGAFRVRPAWTKAQWLQY